LNIGDLTKQEYGFFIESLVTKRFIERLMDFFIETIRDNPKDRGNKPLGHEYIEFLEDCLDVYNKNTGDSLEIWSPNIGEHYDYTKHSREIGAVGETISNVLLPGIPKLKILPFVLTS